jgi:hypothetical protein
VATTPVDASPAGWRASAEQATRRLAAITAVGGLLGLIVGGVGGRLAMMLLARLNPQETGTTSDDGFRIGQFTVTDTIGLLLTGTAFGVVGAGVYTVVRVLMVGPRWFQVLSVAGGPAVVVGAAIVHTDGIDFHLLDPAWLAIGLFRRHTGGVCGAARLIRGTPPPLKLLVLAAPLMLAAAPPLLWIPLAPCWPSSFSSGRRGKGCAEHRAARAPSPTQPCPGLRG